MRSLVFAALLAPLALTLFAAPAAATEPRPPAAGSSEAPDTLLEEKVPDDVGQPERSLTATPNQDALERYEYLVVVDGLALVDGWAPDAVGQGAEAMAGFSTFAGVVRVLAGVAASRGPATPSYCLTCDDAPIPVHPSLQLLGLTVGPELILPFGPIRPFVGVRAHLALAAGEAAPYAPSAMLSLHPRLGLELPLPADVAVRLSTGLQLDTHRWIFGEPPPWPGVGRASPQSVRLAFGVGLTKAF